jgi:hypothetical protein
VIGHPYGVCRQAVELPAIGVGLQVRVLSMRNRDDDALIDVRNEIRSEIPPAVHPLELQGSEHSMSSVPYRTSLLSFSHTSPFERQGKRR